MSVNSRRYIDKIARDPLPSISEEERIYLNVSYKARGFAKYCNCGFDSVKKLWFAGLHNSNLKALIKLYGINDETSENAKQMLQSKISEEK